MYLGLNVVSILMAQSFVRWLNGDTTAAIVAYLGRSSLILIGGGVVAMVLLFFSLRYRLRTLDTDDKGLRLADRKSPLILWEELQCVVIERISGDDSLVSVMFYAIASSRKGVAGRYIRPWIIILERHSQLPELLRELRNRSVMTSGFLVRELDEPVPCLSRTVPFHALLGVYLAFIGLWLAGLGFIVLCVSFSPKDKFERNEVHNQRPPAAFEYFVMTYCKPLGGLRKFCVDVGSAMSGAGVLLFIVGSREMKKSLGRNAAEDARLEVEKVRTAPGVSLI